MTDEQITALKERLIVDGIAEVREAYASDDPRQAGAIEGFELARHLATRDDFMRVIGHRLKREMAMRHDASESNIDRYWAHRWATLQIEWVLECLKVASWAREGDMLSSRAARKVAEVLT